MLIFYGGRGDFGVCWWINVVFEIGEGFIGRLCVLGFYFEMRLVLFSLDGDRMGIWRGIIVMWIGFVSVVDLGLFL